MFIGLVPNGRQAIIWIKYGLFYWRIYASLCFDQLGCDAIPLTKHAIINDF